MRPWVTGRTIGQVLAATARQFPDRDFLICPKQKRISHIAYKEFDDLALRCAAGLLLDSSEAGEGGLGLKRGDHVGVWATNLAEWVILQYAAAIAGVVLVTINPAYRPNELAYTLRHADIKALFMTSEFKTSNFYEIFEKAAAAGSAAGIVPSSASQSSSGGQVHHHLEHRFWSSAFPQLRHVVSMKASNYQDGDHHSSSAFPTYTVPFSSLIDAGSKRHVQSSFPLFQQHRRDAEEAFFMMGEEEEGEEGNNNNKNNNSSATNQKDSSGLAPNDLINVQFTSGTTGLPKAAMLTHQNILLNAYYVTQRQHITEKDKMNIPVPFYHCFGCVMGSLGAVTRGAALVIPAEYFDPTATLKALQEEECSVQYGVPTMFSAMLTELEHNEKKCGFSSAREKIKTHLRTGVMAGSLCPMGLMKKVVHDLGCKNLTICYGQTETSPVNLASFHDDPLEVRCETVGSVIPGVEVCLRDLESGEEVNDFGKEAELCVRGHGIFLGYYKDEEQTRRSFTADGWLRSGDIAIARPHPTHSERSPIYTISGRSKDLIIRGGENISPKEVEDVLFSHPAVLQPSVFGIPDKKMGEIVVAWVQPKDGRFVSTASDAQKKELADALRNHCKENISHFKVPAMFRFVDEFPQTVSGKIQKFRMREIESTQM